MKVLQVIEFGSPILRSKARHLSVTEAKSTKTQTLVQDMRHTLISKKLGIAVAAPQISEPVALAVIAVRPTKHRPKVEEFDLVIVNPKIVQTFGKKKPQWEGCISSGSGEANLFAKVPRYERIKVSYLDENGEKQINQFSGLVAQAIQHETDHLEGILFVDRVEDTKTYMTMKEYKKRIKPKVAAKK